MSLLKKIFGKTQRHEPAASSLASDIKEASDWAKENLRASGYLSDYSLESVADLDRFMEEEKDGVLQQEDRGIIFFALGSYLGETVRSLYGGQWLTDDKDPRGEVKITVLVDEETSFMPVQACIKRYKYGQDSSLYDQVTSLFPNVEDDNGDEVDCVVDDLLITEEEDVLVEPEALQDETNNVE